MKHFISSLSVINANTPPCEDRVSSRKILSLLLILFLGITNAWGESAEMSTFTATSAGMDDYISYTTAKGGGTSNPAVNNSQIRLYQGAPGGSITISAKEGATITEVTISSAMKTAIRWEIDGTKDASNTSLAVDEKVTKSGILTNSITCHCYGSDKNSRLYVNYLKVVYTVEGGETPGEGGDEEPEEPNPGTGGESLSYTWDLSTKSYSAASTDQVTWSSTDVNMVVDKANSTTNANNYLPTTRTSSRFYTSSKLTITPEANVTITSVVFTATSTSYAGALQGSTWTNASASVSGTTVTVTPTNGASAISATIGGTCGFTGVTVHYTKAASDEPEPVIVKTLKSIAVTGMKTTYEQGDIFKFNGTCTATYSVTKDGVAQADETAEVTPTSVSTPNMNTIGTQTITVTYETVSTTYDITITENEVTPGTYNVLLDNVLWNVASGQQTASVESMSGKANDITFYTTKGSSQMYANATQTRFYKDQTFTISVPEGYLIKSITFAEPASDKKWDGSITVNTGTYTDGTKTWTGSVQEVTYTFGAQNRIANAEITYEVAPVEPTKTLTSIEITTPATQTTFWQGETFNYNGLVVTAHYSDAADEVVTPTVTGSTATAGTQTVTVSYNEGATTKTATYTITVKDIPNTKETAYSVADAYDIIDKLGTASGVFISGIISQVDSYNSTYKSITYWISADGTTTNQLQVYGGLGLDEADFLGKTDLSVGDQVIVCGNLKKFSGTYEFDKNNYLASHTPTTKDPAGLAYAPTSYTANVGEAFTTPELTNPNNLVVTYSTSDASKATVDANIGAVTIVATGEVTITATTIGDATHDAGSASYNITITDPSLAVATLPFEYNSGKAAIETTAGMTQEGLGNDYSGTTNLRFDNTGDCVIIHFNGQAEKLAYDIKGNSFSNGTFTVQQSADGSAYTDVVTYTELGNAATKEHELAAESRYVKFIYTEKVDGNVGLGNIKITEPDNRADVGLAWNPATVSLTVGDAFTAPTLNNPHSVDGITYESSNDEVATVTTAGVIALGSATGTATITATYAGDGTYKPATATCVVIVNEYVEMVLGVWQLVKDAALKAGDKVIVASADAVDGKYYALSTTQNKNNRGQADVNKIEENVTFSTDVQVLTLEVGVEENTFAFNTGSGYLYAASSSANHLKTQEDLDANGSWTISIDANTGVATVKAQGGNTHNLMQYNKSSKLFSSYDNPQQGIALYKKMPDYTREVDPQYYGTICLPKAGKFVGGSLYEVAYYDETTKKVYFDEVLNGEMEAGMPYIFLANATMIEAYYTNDEEAAAKHKNGLYGTLVDITSGMNEDGVYMIYRNQIIHSTNSGSYLNANRAYIKFTEELPGYNDPSYVAQAPAPGRKRIAMGTTGQNTATGVDQVQGDEVPTKMIINGQLFILRGEKMYDAQGKLVK